MDTASKLIFDLGFFNGDDTQEDVWARYVKFRELRDVDYKELTIGWLDLHASL